MLAGKMKETANMRNWAYLREVFFQTVAYLQRLYYMPINKLIL
jgi:hypothetical protein